MAFQKRHQLNLGNQYAKGMRHTEEWKQKARERAKGNNNGFQIGKPSVRKGKKSSTSAWNKGKKMPEKSGENAWNWVKDRTEITEKARLRASVEWKVWRGGVFERDLYTCKECGVSGVYIEPHHITPIREAKEKMFDVKNGITLCRPCHKKTLWKESDFAER